MLPIPENRWACECLIFRGGPGFPFTQAVSLVVNCESQRVTAALWQMEKLDLAELERAAAG